jgi:hypothetical protein
MLMTRFLHSRVSPRKGRLFAVACCRRIEHLLLPVHRQAIQTAERYADGLVTAKELHEAWDAVTSCGVKDAPDRSAAYAAVASLVHRHAGHALHNAGMRAALAVLFNETPIGGAEFPDFYARVRRSRQGKALAARLNLWQCGLLCDVFGPLPFRALRLEVDWRTTEGRAARQVAEHIYAERAFDLLPALGDALEETGCADAEVLAHCRAAREHVRGCWALDLALGRD